MRNHNRAVLLRLTDPEFLFLKSTAASYSMSMQDFLRDLIRYGKLPPFQIIDNKKKIKKSLTA